MKKRQPVGTIRSAGKEQDIDRNFIVIPEVAPDQWRESLDVFFDENETGLDQVRQLDDIGRADVDHYYFTSGYELYHVTATITAAGPSPKPSLKTFTRRGDVIPVYESTGCFRYAMPS